MLRAMLLSLLSLAFLSCNDREINGILSIFDNISLTVIETVNNDDDPFCRINPEDCEEWEEEVEKQLASGEYDVKLSFNRQSELIIKLSGTDLKLPLPNTDRIPEENGSFTYTAEEINQLYDLVGEVATTRELGERREERERCTYERREYYCYPTPQGTACDWRWVAEWGWRWVEFDPTLVTKNVSFNLVSGEETPARFEGSRSHEERDYIYIGRCR